MHVHTHKLLASSVNSTESSSTHDGSGYFQKCELYEAAICILMAQQLHSPSTHTLLTNGNEVVCKLYYNKYRRLGFDGEILMNANCKFF